MNDLSVGTLATTSGVNGTRAGDGGTATRQPRPEGPAGSSPGSDAAVDAGPSWVCEGSWRAAGPSPAPDLDHLCFPGAQCPWVPDTPTPSYAKRFPGTGTAPPPPATSLGGISQTSWWGWGEGGLWFLELGALAGDGLCGGRRETGDRRAPRSLSVAPPTPPRPLPHHPQLRALPALGTTWQRTLRFHLGGH